MNREQRLDSLAASVARGRARLALARMPLPAARALFYEEIAGSCALAGAAFRPGDVRSLLEADAVTPGRTLAEHVVVADYGTAARFVRSAAPSRRRLLALEEIAHLHALAVRRAPENRPGRWREATARPYPSGVVPPPAWSVPREMTAYAERVASGPTPTQPLFVWLAEAHARFLRIHPFDGGNGRAARLLVNLLLRRLDLPPFVIRPREAERYVAALRAADARDPRPLAIAIAASLDRTLHGLLGDDGGEPPRAIAAFATGAERAALYKAAQRGRLRTVRRGGAVLTTRAWIDAYRAARHKPEATATDTS